MFEIFRDITVLIHLVNVLGAFDAAFPLTATHMPCSNFVHNALIVIPEIPKMQTGTDTISSDFTVRIIYLIRHQSDELPHNYHHG